MSPSAAILALLEAERGRGARDHATAGGAWVLRATVYDRAAGAAKTLYEASEVLTTNATDTPAHTKIGYGRLVPPNLEQDATGDGVPIADGIPRYLVQGPIVLLNPDGDLDSLSADDPTKFVFNSEETYAYEGAKLELLFGSVADATGGSFSTGFEVVSTVHVRHWESDPARVTLHVKDGASALDVPVQENAYVDNEFGSLPPSLVGQRKPLLWGAFTGVKPVLIDAAALIYQLNDDGVAAITSVSAVYEGGASVGTSDGDVANIAALRAHTFTNDYVTCLAAGMIRLRAQPDKEPTANGVGMSPGPGYTLGNIATDILTNLVTPTPTIASGAFSGGWWDFQGVLYLDGTRDDTVRDVLGRLAPPLHAIFQNRDGEIDTFGITADPSVSAVALALETDDVVTWKREKTAPPLWDARIGWGRVWFPLTDFTGSVDAGEQVRQSTALRFARSSNEAIRTGYPDARAERIETSLVSEANAKTISDTMLALFGEPRAMVTLELAGRFSDYDLGTICSYAEDRPPFGPASGTLDDEAGVALDTEAGADIELEDDPYHAVVCGWVEHPPNDYSLKAWI